MGVGASYHGLRPIVEFMTFNFAMQVEKRNLFNVLLKQFLVVYRNWELTNLGQSPDDGASAISMTDSEPFSNVVIGCSFGPPVEIIHVIAEVTQITTMVTKYSTSVVIRASLGDVDILSRRGLKVLQSMQKYRRGIWQQLAWRAFQLE